MLPSISLSNFVATILLIVDFTVIVAMICSLECTYPFAVILLLKHSKCNNNPQRTVHVPFYLLLIRTT